MIDRIGPDIPITQIPLLYKPLMRYYCKKKFKRFGNNSEFRLGAIAVGCSNISIGDNVVIRPGTRIFAGENRKGEIYIEDDVLIGCDVHLYCTNHIYSDKRIPILYQKHIYKPIKLLRGCWIGAGSIILYGTTIGENSVVGAGSVVTHNVESYTVVAGNPAKLIKII